MATAGPSVHTVIAAIRRADIPYNNRFAASVRAEQVSYDGRVDLTLMPHAHSRESNERQRLDLLSSLRKMFDAETERFKPILHINRNHAFLSIGLSIYAVLPDDERAGATWEEAEAFMFKRLEAARGEARNERREQINKKIAALRSSIATLEAELAEIEGTTQEPYVFAENGRIVPLDVLPTAIKKNTAMPKAEYVALYPNDRWDPAYGFHNPNE